MSNVKSPISSWSWRFWQFPVYWSLTLKQLHLVWIVDKASWWPWYCTMTVIVRSTWTQLSVGPSITSSSPDPISPKIQHCHTLVCLCLYTWYCTTYIQTWHGDICLFLHTHQTETTCLLQLALAHVGWCVLEPKVPCVEAHDCPFMQILSYSWWTGSNTQTFLKTRLLLYSVKVKDR